MNIRSIWPVGRLFAVLGTVNTGLLAACGIAFGAGGDLLWQDQVNPAGGQDEASAIAVRGRAVFAAGRVRNAAGNDDWFVRAYAAGTNTVLWQDQLDMAGNDDDAHSVAVQGRSVFVAGRVGNAAGNDDWFVRAYDAGTGAVLWQDQFDMAGNDDEALFIAARGRSVFVAGRVRNAAGNDDWFVRAYDAVTGTVLWQNQFDKAGDDDEAPALAVQGSRVFVVGGVINAAGDEDWLVRAYDAANGALLWEDQINKAGGDDKAVTVAVRGRSIFVAGRARNAADNDDWLVRAYDGVSGALLWENQLDKAGGRDRAVALVVRGNSVFAAGRVRNAVINDDWLVRAYDTGTGTVLWEDQLDKAAGSDQALALAVRGSSLFAVGRVRNGSGNNDWLVRAYNVVGGALLWENQLDLAGDDDEAVAVVVQGNRVFVAGDVTNAAGNADWLVRASAVK